jgi:hypothetical protein
VSRDERDITSTIYQMMLIELGYRVTRSMIDQNVDLDEESA